MNNINFERVFKYGFIASIVMILVGALLKVRMLIASFELLALVCGLLLAAIVIADLLGWRKANTPKTKKSKKL